jgi:phenylpropionate dioxygenase-like ring-hydroxylating dioxygenase large terminal subunit
MPRSDVRAAVERAPVVAGAPHAPALGAPLEPSLSIDPALVEIERRAIFGRTWQLAGHVADLAEPGTYLTTNVVDQPVLVVRDHGGDIRAFRSVCRHRGSRLLVGSGSCGKAMRCLYHGWTHRLDGALIGVPEGREVEGLDKSRPACTACAPEGYDIPIAHPSLMRMLDYDR